MKNLDLLEEAQIAGRQKDLLAREKKKLVDEVTRLGDKNLELSEQVAKSGDMLDREVLLLREKEKGELARQSMTVFSMYFAKF